MVLVMWVLVLVLLLVVVVVVCRWLLLMSLVRLLCLLVRC
jgi:hypothetical protein